MQLSYLPIRQDYVDTIRRKRIDNFGHPVEISIAGDTGYGPCRCCLKQFKPGERRLLFSYAPVGADNPYDEVGPVYIHEDCAAYDQAAEFPPEVKKGRLPIRLVLRCYNEQKRMIRASFVKDNNEAEQSIKDSFADPQVAFIHIRNATYQCFIAEVRKVDQGMGS